MHAQTPANATPKQTHYDVLGISINDLNGLSDDAIAELVKKKYRTSMLTTHSDRNKDDNATASTQALIEAHQVLSDSNQRQLYNLELMAPTPEERENIRKKAEDRIIREKAEKVRMSELEEREAKKKEAEEKQKALARTQKVREQNNTNRRKVELSYRVDKTLITPQKTPEEEIRYAGSYAMLTWHRAPDRLTDSSRTTRLSPLASMANPSKIRSPVVYQHVREANIKLEKEYNREAKKILDAAHTEYLEKQKKIETSATAYEAYQKSFTQTSQAKLNSDKEKARQDINEKYWPEKKSAIIKIAVGCALFPLILPLGLAVLGGVNLYQANLKNKQELKEAETKLENANRSKTPISNNEWTRQQIQQTNISYQEFLDLETIPEQHKHSLLNLKEKYEKQIKDNTTDGENYFSVNSQITHDILPNEEHIRDIKDLIENKLKSSLTENAARNDCTTETHRTAAAVKIHIAPSLAVTSA